jgi:hypothetical protein
VVKAIFYFRQYVRYDKYCMLAEMLTYDISLACDVRDMLSRRRNSTVASCPTNPTNSTNSNRFVEHVPILIALSSMFVLAVFNILQSAVHHSPANAATDAKEESYRQNFFSGWCDPSFPKRCLAVEQVQPLLRRKSSWPLGRTTSLSQC